MASGGLFGGPASMFSGFPAASKSDPFPRSCTTITAYPYLPSSPVCDAKPSHERCEKKQCHPLLLPRRTLAVHHGHYDPHQVRTLDVMGLETTGRGSRDGAGCLQSCLQRVLPNAQSVSFCLRPKMDHFLYLLVVPPEKRGYCFSRVDVPLVRPSGSQHGNVHHKLQYIAAHLGPLFRTDLKLSWSHQWRPTTSGCSVGHRCGSTSIPCLSKKDGRGLISRPSGSEGPALKQMKSIWVQSPNPWNPILFTNSWDLWMFIP